MLSNWQLWQNGRQPNTTNKNMPKTDFSKLNNEPCSFSKHTQPNIFPLHGTFKAQKMNLKNET